jgi:aquaporin Z
MMLQPPAGAAPAGTAFAARPAALRRALRAHWPEYLIEGALLGLFMISAASFGTFLEHPASPLRRGLPDPLLRRALMGAAMGLTSVALVHSPWGKRSGAHMNPALTLTFLRLGKVAPADSLFYSVSQFAGGALGLALAAAALGTLLADPSVNYVATQPGPAGAAAAFAAEAAIAFILMLAILTASNLRRAARFTGLAVGALVACYITFEAPVSGMSLNPARSFASALPPRLWRGLWIYFTAPPLGMLAASQAYLWLRGAGRVHCAKLHHDNSERCIFRCRWGDLAGEERASPAAAARPGASA